MAPPHRDPHTINVALLGCGNVGLALYELLAEPTQRQELHQRTGLWFDVVGVAVADPAKHRTDASWFNPALLTTSAADLVERPDVHVVVELMGGIEGTDELLHLALRSNKSVVSANKALFAMQGRRLAKLAADRGVELRYEAAVAGAIPILRVLRESLAGERIERVMGIVNGTTNFILSKMDAEGRDYGEVLAEAQELGLAERDPAADVEGYDAAAKAAILATMAFGSRVVTTDVYREGITGVRLLDVEFSRRLGYVIKLLAICERLEGEEISVRVHPAMVPSSHPLASVEGAFNAVFVEGAACGELMLYGRGAGGRPTASAVLGDLIEVGRAITTDRPVVEVMPPHPLNKRRMADLMCAFYVTVDVKDRPGVLAAVTAVFGNHGVSIRSMEQVGLGAEARLIFVTHVAREGAMAATLRDLRRLSAVDRVGSMLRVVADDDGEVA